MSSEDREQKEAEEFKDEPNKSLSMLVDWLVSLETDVSESMT